MTGVAKMEYGLVPRADFTVMISYYKKITNSSSSKHVKWAIYYLFNK